MSTVYSTIYLAILPREMMQNQPSYAASHNSAWKFQIQMANSNLFTLIKPKRQPNWWRWGLFLSLSAGRQRLGLRMS